MAIIGWCALHRGWARLIGRIRRCISKRVMRARGHTEREMVDGDRLQLCGASSSSSSVNCTASHEKKSFRDADESLAHESHLFASAHAAKEAKRGDAHSARKSRMYIMYIYASHWTWRVCCVSGLTALCAHTLLRHISCTSFPLL